MKKKILKIFVLLMFVSLFTGVYAFAAELPVAKIENFRISLDSGEVYPPDSASELDGGGQFFKNGTDLQFKIIVKKDENGVYEPQNIAYRINSISGAYEFSLAPFCKINGVETLLDGSTYKLTGKVTEGDNTVIKNSLSTSTDPTRGYYRSMEIVAPGTAQGYIKFPATYNDYSSGGKVKTSYGEYANKEFKFTIIVEEEAAEDKDYSVEIINEPSGYTEGDDVNLRVRASVTSGTGISSQPVLVVVGLFDKSGKMINYSYVEQTIAPGEGHVLAAGFKLPEASAGYEVRVFIWDEWNTPTVLSKKVIIPVTAKP